MKQNEYKIIALSLGTALLLGMSGCGSSDDSDNSSSTSTTTTATSSSQSGVAIDGILMGSTVCIDVNVNNMCDAGEPSTITDNLGKFTIPATTAKGPLLLVGGIDQSTGAAFTGSLKAPEGSSVVTPLTSAVQSLVEKDKTLVEKDKKVQKAEASVKTAMGLSDVDLTTFDPYAEIDGTNAQKAKEVLAKQTQLQVLVHAATVTVAGADEDTDVDEAMSTVFDAIVENFDGAEGEVVLDAQTVSAATKNAADKVYADKPKARVAAKVVAQSSAENSVRDADSAAATIENGDASAAVDNLDAAIAKANTSSEESLRAAAKAAIEEANKLTAEKIAEIEALQKAQQEKEAAIAAAKAAQAAAQAEAEAAKAEAQRVAADAAASAQEQKAAYEKQLEAELEAQRQATLQAEAEAAAARAAKEAAEQEKLIAAQAAQREAEAEAAEAQAEAEKLAAQAREAAAQKAVEEAKAAEDLAKAQAAVAAAEAAAKDTIALASIAAEAEIANFIFVTLQRDMQEVTALVAALEGVDTTVADASEKAKALLESAQTDLNKVNEMVESKSLDLDAAVGLRAAMEQYAEDFSSTLQKLQEQQAAVALAEAVATANMNHALNEIGEIVKSLESKKLLLRTEALLKDSTEIATIAKKYESNEAIAAAQKSAQEVVNAVQSSVTSLDSDIEKLQQLLGTTTLSEAEVTAALQTAKDAEASLDALLQKQTETEEVVANLLKSVNAIVAELEKESTETTPASGDSFSEGMVFSNLEIEKNSIELRTHELLSDGQFKESAAIFDFESNTFVPLSSEAVEDDSDLILNDKGEWVSESTEFEKYSLDNGNLLFESGFAVKIVQKIDLTTLDSETATSILGFVPEESDITFDSGAAAYVLAFKEIETYSVGYTPKVQEQDEDGNWYETDATFATIGAFMQSVNSLSGVDFARNDTEALFHSGAVLDSNGEEVTTVSAGMKGSLVLVDANKGREEREQVVVGEWEIINLPNDGGLALVGKANSEDTQYLFEDEVVLATVVNGVVRIGEYSQGATEFEVDDESIEFNQIATNNITAAISNYFETHPVTLVALHGTLPESADSLEVKISLNPRTAVVSGTVGENTIEGKLDENKNINSQTLNADGEVVATCSGHINDDNSVTMNVTPSDSSVEPFSYTLYPEGVEPEETDDDAKDDSGDSDESAAIDLSGITNKNVYLASESGFGLYYFGNDNGIKGVTTEGIISGSYKVDGDTVLLELQDTNLTLTFQAQPDFENLVETPLLANGEINMLMSKPPLVPAAYIYEDDAYKISYSSGESEGSIAFDAKEPAALDGEDWVVYAYNPHSGELLTFAYEREDGLTKMIKLPMDSADLSALPIKTYTKEDGLISEESVAWKLPSTTIPLPSTLYDSYEDAYDDQVFQVYAVTKFDADLGALVRTEVAYDAEGTVVKDETFTAPYERDAESGELRVDAGDEYKLLLPLEKTTETNSVEFVFRDVDKETGDTLESSFETWYGDKPDERFPDVAQKATLESQIVGKTVTLKDASGNSKSYNVALNDSDKITVNDHTATLQEAPERLFFDDGEESYMLVFNYLSTLSDEIASVEVYVDDSENEEWVLEGKYAVTVE